MPTDIERMEQIYQHMCERFGAGDNANPGIYACAVKDDADVQLCKAKILEYNGTRYPVENNRIVLKEGVGQQAIYLTPIQVAHADLAYCFMSGKNQAFGMTPIIAVMESAMQYTRMSNYHAMDERITVFVVFLGPSVASELSETANTREWHLAVCGKATSATSRFTYGGKAPGLPMGFTGYLCDAIAAAFKKGEGKSVWIEREFAVKGPGLVDILDMYLA